MSVASTSSTHPLMGEAPTGVQAIVLLGHGSRDADWPQYLQQIATTLSTRHNPMPTLCAFLEHTQPDLMQACELLSAQGIHRIALAPMFVGMGSHLRKDIPNLIAHVQEKIPKLHFWLLQPLGLYTELPELVYRQIAQLPLDTK